MFSNYLYGGKNQNAGDKTGGKPIPKCLVILFLIY